MEHQTVGRWVICPINPETQRIILKIVGILNPIANYQNFPPFWNENSLSTNKEPNYHNGSYNFEHFLSVAKMEEGLHEIELVGSVSYNSLMFSRGICKSFYIYVLTHCQNENSSFTAKRKQKISTSIFNFIIICQNLKCLQ